MAIEVTTYDPKKVNLDVRGVIITGYADGSMIEIERNSDLVYPYVGTQGDVGFAESADQTGKIKIRLKQDSPSVVYLNALAREKGDDAAFPVSIINMNTNGVNCSGTKSRLLKPANEKFDKEITEREFEIFVADLSFD